MIERHDSTLVIVDVQVGFRAYDEYESVVGACRKLVEAARILGVPAMATEQYPKGLGRTAPGVGLLDEQIVEKLHFSAWRADEFTVATPQVVVAGIEAHVCVAQTVLDLLEHDQRAVFVPVDAVASRNRLDYDTALRRLEQAGATLTTVEAVLFEWLGRAGTPEFKQVQGLIK